MMGGRNLFYKSRKKKQLNDVVLLDPQMRLKQRWQIKNQRLKKLLSIQKKWWDVLCTKTLSRLHVNHFSSTNHSPMKRMQCCVIIFDFIRRYVSISTNRQKLVSIQWDVFVPPTLIVEYLVKILDRCCKKKQFRVNIMWVDQWRRLTFDHSFWIIINFIYLDWIHYFYSLQVELTKK